VEAQDSPTYSVIVPAFNSEERIEAVIRSVLGQTRTDLELIVIDDGSADRTAKRAEAAVGGDARGRVIRQANRGTVGARNAGIDAARGSYLSFLDDDDLWLPYYLEAVDKALRSSRGAGLVFTDAWVVDADRGRVGRRSAHERFARPLRRLEPAPTPAASEAALARANFITTCAATVSSQAVEAVGEFDPEICGCDDWDLWLRIVGAGFGAVRVDERLAVLRKRAGSVSSDELLMARNARTVLAAALERGLASAEAERLARLHLRLIDAEITALERGSVPRRVVARFARRIGRKRLPLPVGGWVSPPAELRRLLDEAP